MCDLQLKKKHWVCYTAAFCWYVSYPLVPLEVQKKKSTESSSASSPLSDDEMFLLDGSGLLQDDPAHIHSLQGYKIHLWLDEDENDVTKSQPK